MPDSGGRRAACFWSARSQPPTSEPPAARGRRRTAAKQRNAREGRVAPHDRTDPPSGAAQQSDPTTCRTEHPPMAKPPRPPLLQNSHEGRRPVERRAGRRWGPVASDLMRLPLLQVASAIVRHRLHRLDLA